MVYKAVHKNNERSSFMERWSIEKIYNLKWKKPWRDGYAHFGFHDKEGRQIIINTEFNWVGCIGEGEELEWTAGHQAVPESKYHIMLDLDVPNSGSCDPDGNILFSSEANNKIYKIEPETKKGYVFFDAAKRDFGYIGSCEFDLEGNIWVIELNGFRVWKLDKNGNILLTLGDGIEGFQTGTVSFDEVRFSLISCIKCGKDGNLYLVDSGNFAVRMINPYEKTVTTIVGTGKPGYSGDGGPAKLAKLGRGDYHISFYEGPWYLSVDDKCNIYIADTGNNVVRKVERKSNIITTIAGRHKVDMTKHLIVGETDPMNMNLPYLISVEYYKNRLYVSDWRGDLAILRPIK